MAGPPFPSPSAPPNWNTVPSYNSAIMDPTTGVVGIPWYNLFVFMSSRAAFLQQVEQEVTTLQNQVATLQAQIVVIQGQITTLQAQIVALQGDVTTLQGQVSTLQGQVIVLQGQVIALQAKHNEGLA